MREKKIGFHGSDIERVADYYNIDKEKIINFASNVNPLGLPNSAKSTLPNLDMIISRYPDRDYASLKKTISSYTGVNKRYITVGNGSTEIISLLIHLQKPRRALVIRPTYSEYERELAMIEAETIPYFLDEKLDFALDIDDFISRLDESIDMVIFCNPSNPTGQAVRAVDIKTIISACSDYGIFLLIDETYAEFAPVDISLSALQFIEDYDNFMVIRGASKLFCAPGLRFGYGITSNDAFIKHLRKEQNPWSLNSVGAYLGEIMLKDTDFIAETSELINSERVRIVHEFSKLNSFKLYPSYCNFFLIKIQREGLTSQDVFEKAIKKHLMVRDCSSIDGLNGEFIRFGILSPEENDKLLDIFRQIERGA